MRKLGIFILFVGLIAAFIGLQRSIVRHRATFRVDEKILLVSDDPHVTKIAALGFDNLVCDLGWIRAIQYFGGNFTTLDKPGKREGFVRLMQTLVTLDEHFVPAWKFGGFAFNESVKDATLAIDFLSRGAEKNPDAWDLPFNAGFICYYQLKDTARAKQFFEQAYSPSRFKNGALATLTFRALSKGNGRIALIPNPAAGPLGELSGLVGSIPHELVSASPTVRTATPVVFSTTRRGRSTVRFDIKVQNNSQEIAMFNLRVAYDPKAYRYESAVAAAELRHGTFTVNPVGAGQLLVRGDYVDPNCPSYVPRMAIEMDLAAGRFISAWEQYFRYFRSAIKRGDRVSATIASDKLTKLYSSRAIQWLTQAVEAYHKEKGAYPSTDMHELLNSGVLMQTVRKIIREEPDQMAVLNVLTYGTGDVRHLFFEWRKPDVKQQEPHILIVRTTEEGKEKPVVYNRYDLLSDQKTNIEGLQYAVKAFTEEKGRPPANLAEVIERFKQKYPNGAPKDPLGGEYYLDANAKVRVRNLKY